MTQTTRKFFVDGNDGNFTIASRTEKTHEIVSSNEYAAAIYSVKYPTKVSALSAMSVIEKILRVEL